MEHVLPHAGDEERRGDRQRGAQRRRPAGYAQSLRQVVERDAGQVPEEEVDGGERPVRVARPAVDDGSEKEIEIGAVMHRGKGVDGWSVAQEGGKMGDEIDDLPSREAP